MTSLTKTAKWIVLLFILSALIIVKYHPITLSTQLAETAPETEETTLEPDTTPPESEQETVIGKNVDSLSSFLYFGEVRNDFTESWRYAMFAESGIDFTEYAVSYCQTYMSSGQVHAVINTVDNTTTQLNYYGDDLLYITVREHISGEEHDAKELFSGSVLADYLVHIDTGKIEKL